jgi:hypothetical protein
MFTTPQLPTHLRTTSYQIFLQVFSLKYTHMHECMLLYTACPKAKYKHDFIGAQTNNVFTIVKKLQAFSTVPNVYKSLFK